MISVCPVVNAVRLNGSGLDLDSGYSVTLVICGFTCKYSKIPISRTLGFSKLPIIQTKTDFPSTVKHCNFTPDISNTSMIRTNLLFPRRFEKSGFHCKTFQRECSIKYFHSKERCSTLKKGNVANEMFHHN